MGYFDEPQPTVDESAGVAVDAVELTTFDVALDGSAARIGVRDASGRLASLNLPVDCLSSLLMTLPQVVRTALQCRCDDPTLRLVYPLGGYRVETAGGSDRVILTLATPDGFEVSFGLTSAHRQELIDAFRTDSWPPLIRAQ